MRAKVCKWFAAAIVCGGLTAPAAANTVVTLTLRDAQLGSFFGGHPLFVPLTGSFDYDIDANEILPGFTIDPHNPFLFPAGIDLYTGGGSDRWQISTIAFPNSFLFRAFFNGNPDDAFVLDLQILHTGLPGYLHSVTKDNVFPGAKFLLDPNSSGEDGFNRPGAGVVVLFSYLEVTGITTTGVPEPATLSLVATGLGGLGLFRRSRRKRKTA